jgi:uncharacterized protein
MRKIFLYVFILQKLFLISIYNFFKMSNSICKELRLFIENFLVFQPSRFRARRINKKLLKKFKPIRFIGIDNVRLYAWFIPPKKNKPTILFFHGQAESILSHQDFALMCVENGFGAFMLSYRGHYKSWGKVSEEGVYHDAQSALNKLKELKIKDVILWGHSLGTCVATNTALQIKPIALILQSPIKDINSAALDVCNFYLKRMKLNFLKPFLNETIRKMDFIQKFDNINKINKITCPILIAHSKTDQIAPYANSEELAKKNKNAKVFISNLGSHWKIDWFKSEAVNFIKDLSNNLVTDKI